ncbi:MAG: hypothetical protein V4613_02295 [Bacteroidota bacterium]
MVEVFKTNIEETFQSKIVAAILEAHFPGYKVNFDLDDCDRILRIEAAEINQSSIKTVLNERGYICEVLPD